MVASGETFNKGKQFGISINEDGPKGIQEALAVIAGVEVSGEDPPV